MTHLRVPVSSLPGFIPVTPGESPSVERLREIFGPHIDRVAQRMAESIIADILRKEAQQAEAEAQEQQVQSEALESNRVDTQQNLLNSVTTGDKISRDVLASEERKTRQRRAQVAEGMKRAIGKGGNKRTPKA